jgi:hypothetical protein
MSNTNPPDRIEAINPNLVKCPLQPQIFVWTDGQTDRLDIPASLEDRRQRTVS